MSCHNLKRVFDDDGGMPPIQFYGRQLKKVAKNVNLRDAQAAVSALADSDIEDETEIESYQIEEGSDYGPDLHNDSDQEAEDDEEVGNTESDEEDNVPLSVLAEMLRRNPEKEKKKEKVHVIWKKDEFIPPNTSFTNCDSENYDEDKTPMMYFSKYFPDEVFIEIAEKTNMYSIQNNGKNVNTNEFEIRKLVALHIVMGIIRYPRLRMYWNPATRIQFINNVQIPRNRFESLRNNLHIVDVNDDHNNNDKLWKVRPIISSFENRCEELTVEEHLCIDESIIPFKGQLSIKQYIKGKPNPWGVKVFMLCGASGIIYRSVVYQGSTTLPNNLQENYSATNGLVIHLSRRIPEHQGHKLFCDNYFTSLLLLKELLEKGIYTAGTVRSNRLQKCPLKTESQLKKVGRGSWDSYVTECKTIVAVRWYDNKVVNMVSNFVGTEPEDEVRRWDKKESKYIMVKRPAIIRLYNVSMGGVDKNDFLIALYRTFIRSRKWTLRVIFHYFNLAVCNSWLEYQYNMKQTGIVKKATMDLLEFTMSIAEALAFSGCSITTPKRGRPLSNRNSPNLRQSPSSDSSSSTTRKQFTVVPVSDIRYDNIGHWPVHRDGHEQRCKLEICGARSRIQCEKCKVPLCLSKFKNCFKQFHVP